METLVLGALRCAFLENPVGIEGATPRLSWIADGASARAFRVTAGSSPDASDLWDSGEISGADNAIVWAGSRLQSRQIVFWRVEARGENGIGAMSETASFEMGLLKKSDWRGAKFVGGPLVGSARTGVPLPEFSKSFSLPAGKSIVSARLYCTGLGVYRAHIGGARVGVDELAPGWTSYISRVAYQTHDVASLLKPGENTIDAPMGDGWYCGHIGWRDRATYGDRPRFLGLLIVTFADGSEQVVKTGDPGWWVRYGGRTRADLLMGEHVDAREFSTPWLPTETFSLPNSVELVAPNSPPIVASQEIAPISEPYKHGDAWIFDLGINLVGRVKLSANGPRGTQIRLRYAEVLEKGPLATDGPIYTTNLRAAENTDFFTLAGTGETEVFEPIFTFHGFRYVEVKGFPGTPTKESLTGVVLHSQMSAIGDFTCSDELVNQLQRNIERGWLGNAVDVPTDCPQRDERLGWTGDAQVFCRTSLFLRDCAPFWHKWMRDMRDSQGPRGELPPFAPLINIGENAVVHQDGGPAWADAGVVVPWTVYLSTGDTDILSDNYDLMRRFVDFWIATSKDFIRCYDGYEGWAGFGDWLALDGSGKTDGGTPKDLIGTAYLAFSSRLLSKAARVLGKTSDAKKYERVFEKTRAAFIARFVTAGGLVAPLTQTAFVLALHFDLLPEDARAKAVAELVADIRRREYKTTTGFVGSSYLPHVLTGAGELDTMYRLLFQTGWPSYLYAVTQGATTIWERWDGWTREKGFQDAGMNSFNHYAYGAIGSWLYQSVAGIDLDESAPGYARIVLKPHLAPNGTPGLSRARASLDSVRGRIESAWEVNDDTFDWKITIPASATGLAHVPQPNGSRRVVELAPGSHRFTVNLAPAR